MRIEQLTFTRFIAAMAIVFFHFGKSLNIFSGEIIHTLLIQANIGVSYFFILSGFVMIIAYGKKSEVGAVSYMKNRFARIYPLYIFAILLSLLNKSFFVQERYYVPDIIENILAIQSWIPRKAMSINFPGWSLSVEFFFYAVFPFAFNYFYRKFSVKKLFVPILLIWLVSQLWFNWALNSGLSYGTETETHNFLFYFPLLHLNQFLIGNLTGLFFIKYLQNKQGNYDWILVLCGILLILSLIFRPENISYHNGLMAVIFVPFIIFTALNTGVFTRIFEKKFPVYLGEISYGVYILQVPVYTMTQYFLNKAGINGSFVVFGIGIIVLLVVSAISYHWIEKPLREKIKNLKFSF